MNLEAIEQKCVAFLQQAENPLASVEQLLHHLHEKPEFATLSQDELLGFLRDHEQFKMVEPVGLGGMGGAASELEATGLSMSPRVILRTRIPTPEQLMAQMTDEMEKLTGALTTALRDAKDAGEAERVRNLMKVLYRAQELRARLDDL